MWQGEAWPDAGICQYWGEYLSVPVWDGYCWWWKVLALPYGLHTVMEPRAW